MRREMPAAIDAAAPVSDLVFGRLMPTGETAIPVTMHGEIVGLVGQREVAAVPRSEWESTPITHILASPSDVPTLRADEDGFEALRRLGGTNRDALLVVDGDHVVGMIRRMDLMRWIELQSQDHPTPPSGLGLWRSAERRGH
jgi:predicted transcriptional regulator